MIGIFAQDDQILWAEQFDPKEPILRNALQSRKKYPKLVAK